MKISRRQFLRDIKQYGNKVICFGAGRYFKNIYAFLKAENIVIEDLLDNDESKWNYAECGIEIHSPKKLTEYSRNGGVILITSKVYAEEIEGEIKEQYKGRFSIYSWPLEYEDLEDNDISWLEEHYFLPCEFHYREIGKRMNNHLYAEEKIKQLRDTSKIVLPRIPFILTTRCTLRCKECSNLIPYYCNPKDYDVKEVLDCIDNVCNQVDEWICIELVGGEPFLYKEIDTVLKHIISIDKIQEIEITTNGSCIPQSSTIELLKNPKAVIKISEYPGVVDPRKVITLFEKEGIFYNYLSGMGWTPNGGLEKRNRTPVQLQSQYANCSAAKNCRTILNGKLYPCSKAASLAEIGIVKDMESVELINNTSLRKELKDFMSIRCSRACDYCDVASLKETIVPPAEQLTVGEYLWENL